jgi:TolB-like protein
MQQVVAMPAVRAAAGPVLAVTPAPGGTAAPEDALLAAGLLKEVCGELARFATLRVVSWASSHAAAELSEAEIADRLGATHVLRGGLRRLGDRVRLRVELVDCAAGLQLWSERFETDAEAVFAVQDEVVGRIATSMVARLEEATVRAALRRPATSLAAYELTLRGLAELREGSVAADEAAREMFRRALAFDPHYARAEAGLSLSHFNEWSCQHWSRFAENGRLAYAHAHRALALDDRDAMVHVVIGRVLLYHRRFELASWYFDRALALSPNDADLLVQLAIGEVFLGRPDVALGHVQRAMRLNPYHPQIYHAIEGFAWFGLRHYDRAVECSARGGPVPYVNFPFYVALSLARLGRLDEAQAELARFLERYRVLIAGGREPEPGEPWAWMAEVEPYRRSEDDEHLLAGLRLIAGGDRIIGAPASAAPARPAAAAFAPDGDGWSIAYEGRRARLPAMKGLADIQRLLARPGEEIHCLDLAERGDAELGADAVLDDTARAQLKARIRDLQEEIGEAEDRNDIGRTERLRAEFDTLVETFAAAVGLGGRSRRLGNLAERARSAVTWRIRHAQRRIAAAHPALGRHLENSLRTGTFCAYRPERPVDWRFQH